MGVDARGTPARAIDDLHAGGPCLAVRGEVFNLFNRANFDVPNRVGLTPNFGGIFSAGPGRQMQIGVKFVF
jgi:hypothetical protein